MTQELKKLCDKASEIILSFPKKTRIRVISHYDADGITSAAILCKSLHRADYDFQATLMRNPFDKGLLRISKEDNDLIIFSDMGSGQIETIEQIDCKTIIIDHHQYLKSESSKNVLQINANLCGIDGNYEACGATLCFSVAKSIDAKNVDLSPLALAGATGDKQYIGGFRGYNKTILDDALKNGYLKPRNGIKIYGDTLYLGLYYSAEPYFSGLSGNEKGVFDFLTKLNLDKDVKIEELNNDQLKQINSQLLFKLIKKDCQKNILDTVIRKRYWSESLGCELERFADLLDACGKGGDRSLGLMICLEDKNALQDALVVEKEYKQKILDELIQIDNDGVKEKNAYRYFYSKDSSLGGVIGGIATNYILDKEKPLISMVRKEDKNELHVSCRANQYLVSNGLDLGLAMKMVAKKLEGHGGGHKIAAGATINIEKEEEFLDIVDSIISEQLKEVL